MSTGMGMERERVSTTAVIKISEELGEDPLDIRPLSESIDPEALDRLVASASDVRLQFEHEGIAVTVTSDGVAIDG